MPPCTVSVAVAPSSSWESRACTCGSRADPGALPSPRTKEQWVRRTLCWGAGGGCRMFGLLSDPQTCPHIELSGSLKKNAGTCVPAPGTVS